MGQNNLSVREYQVAELVAWGCSQKEVASHLGTSQNTIDNHIQNVKRKIGCNKITEISAWWFCTRFNISFDLSPLRRGVLSTVLLGLFIVGEFYNSSEICRYGNREKRVQKVEQRFKRES